MRKLWMLFFNNNSNMSHGTTNFQAPTHELQFSQLNSFPVVYLKNRLIQSILSDDGLELIKILNLGLDVNSRWSETQSSLLMVAAHYGRLGMLWILLDRGAYVNARDRNGRTALFYVVSGCGEAEICRYLLNRGMDAIIRDRQGKNAMIVAMEHRRQDLADIIRDRLLANGELSDHEE
mmetsp:Transcript_15328/g.26809  ORF Transcript_15328/g.26809 Transcript_15328/m.26809 type:complete len:178 (+) Transcript_15328:44-577(+)